METKKNVIKWIIRILVWLQIATIILQGFFQAGKYLCQGTGKLIDVLISILRIIRGGDDEEDEEEDEDEEEEEDDEDEDDEDDEEEEEEECLKSKSS